MKTKISSHLPIIFLLSLIFFPSLTSSMSTLYSNFFNNRYEIRDLIKNGTCFTTYANMWTASSKSQTNQISSCADGYSILGGINMLGSNTASQSGEYFQRSYASLRTHNVIFFTFTFYALGSWDPSDYFQLNFDGTILNGFNTIYILNYYENPQCTGASSGLRNIKGFGNVLHSSSTLNFQFISRMNENNLNEAWGFREFNTFFVQMTSPPANSFCVKGSDDTVTSLDCACPEGFYGASCSACDLNCASCWGPSASQCFQCKPGSSLVGTTCVTCPPGCSFCSGTAYNTCVDCIPGWFLINGNQCIPRCDPPLVQGSDAYDCVATCSTPCTTTTDYIYWDGTCSAACPVPLTQGTLFGIPGLNTCNLPCDNGQYFFLDGSCSATCDAPRYSVNMNAQQYCIDPCPVGQYLYWNSTCSNECKFPLTQTPSHNQILCQYGCSSTQYLYWDGSCAASCPFPLSTRIENGYKFCDFPLEDTTQFLYYDGSSAATCPAPLSTRIQGTIFVRKYCDYLCSSSQYLYANGTCGNYCNYPLTVTIKGGKQFCNNPCGSDFLYWNGSCISTCNSPYYQRLEPGVNYCDYSCIAPLYYYWDGSCLPSCASPLKAYNEGTVNSRYCIYTCASSEFLYWNETCSSSCNFPLVQQTYKSKQFCTYPCSDQQFLYYNGTCSDNCLEPFVERRENGYGFCEFPCSMSSEYMLWNETCMTDCPSPLAIQLGPYGERYCNLPCASPFRFYVVETGQCLTECDTNSIIENELFPVCSLEGPSDDSGLIEALLTADGKSGTYSLIAPVKLSSYIKYLKVQQSPRLNKFTASLARPILSLKFNIPLPDSFVEYFVYEGIPSDYSPNGIPQLHTSFMVNYWNNFSTLMVVLAAALLLIMINFGVKRSTCSENVKQTVEKIKIVFMWNFCLLLIAINSDEIILYAYLDFKTMVLDKGSSTLSLIACLFFLGLLAGILITGFILVFRRQSLKNSALKLNNPKNYDDFLYSWDGWQIVFRGYQDERFLSSFFYLIYIVRFFLPSITMIVFMDYPLTQSVLQGLITFGIIEIILLLNPIKNRASQIQLLTVETLTLMINACAFFLAIFDHTDYSGLRARVLIGDIIILGNFLITMTMITFIVVKLGREIIEIWKAKKARKSIGSADWVRLFVILLQQYAFGFEEIFPRNQYNTVYKNINRDVAAADNKQDLHRHIQQSERQGLSFTDFKKEGLHFGDATDQLNSSRPISLASTATAHSPVKKRLDRLREKRSSQVINAHQNLEEEKDGDDVISDNVSVVSMNLSNVGLVGRGQSSSSIIVNEENPAAKKWARRKLKKPEREPRSTFSEINFDQTHQGFEGADNTFGGGDFRDDNGLFPEPERDRGSLMEDHNVSGFSNRPRRINRSRSPDLEPSVERGFKLVGSPRNEGGNMSVNERRTSDFRLTDSPSIERRMSPGRKNIKNRTQEMKSLFKLS